MKGEEVLVIEHREIVELYKHYSTNIIYIFFSYIILNGVMAAFLATKDTLACFPKTLET